jgi:hypothetical protein
MVNTRTTAILMALTITARIMVIATLMTTGMATAIIITSIS